MTERKSPSQVALDSNIEYLKRVGYLEVLEQSY
jgi:hypothetical protein